MTYIALLRGINVGGNNIIKMAELKTAFEAVGCSNVVTYIQSGNIVFSYPRAACGALETTLEEQLLMQFSYRGFVVVLRTVTLEQIIKDAPAGFGTEPERFRYDVIYLKDATAARELFDTIPVRPGVDEKYLGKHSFYFRRSIQEAGKSQFSKIISLPVYQYCTVRNWNTTTKLATIATQA